MKHSANLELLRHYAHLFQHSEIAKDRPVYTRLEWKLDLNLSKPAHIGELTRCTAEERHKEGLRRDRFQKLRRPAAECDLRFQGTWELRSANRALAPISYYHTADPYRPLEQLASAPPDKTGNTNVN